MDAKIEAIKERIALLKWLLQWVMYMISLVAGGMLGLFTDGAEASDNQVLSALLYGYGGWAGWAIGGCFVLTGGFLLYWVFRNINKLEDLQ